MVLLLINQFSEEGEGQGIIIGHGSQITNELCVIPHIEHLISLMYLLYKYLISPKIDPSAL